MCVELVGLAAKSKKVLISKVLKRYYDIQAQSHLLYKDSLDI
jgi:hypothetical protein